MAIIQPSNMTNEQFNTLARYDEEIRIAATRRWARVPSRSALKEIHDTLLAISGPRPRLNPLCHTCVLRLLQDAGKLYLPEKERREAEAQAMREAAEKAEKAEIANAKPKAKKTPAKKAKTPKTEK